MRHHNSIDVILGGDNGPLYKRLRCVECGVSGGSLVLLECEHRTSFVVHAARVCMRRYDAKYEVKATDGVEIERWAARYTQGMRAGWSEHAPPNCDACKIYQFGRSEVKTETEKEATMNDKPETMAEKTFWKLLSEKAKDEGAKAGIRVGARQFMKTAKVPVLGALRRRGVNTNSLEGWLETPFGEGTFGVGLGLVLPYVPGFHKLASKVVAEELRVQGMSVIGSELADILLDPLREAMLTAFGEDNA